MHRIQYFIKILCTKDILRNMSRIHEHKPIQISIVDFTKTGNERWKLIIPGIHEKDDLHEGDQVP
jgi:hypothetical protein